MSDEQRNMAIDAIDRERKEKHLFNTAEDGLLEARRIINTLPSAQPEYKELQDWKTDFKGFIDDLLYIPRDDYRGIMEYINEVPTAQPEQPTEIQDILAYLDEEVHPIVSPNNWNIYSELHDMISKLSAQPERKKGIWEIYVISLLDGEGCRCSECGFEGVPYWNFCPNCGADMEGGET